MDEHIFYLMFGQIKSCVDAQSEVVKLRLAIPCPALLEDTHAQKGLGIAQQDRNLRQSACKHLPVKLIKPLLQVCGCRLHFMPCPFLCFILFQYFMRFCEVQK